MNQGHLIGHTGESLAALLLLHRKHHIVSRNFIARGGELDIISLRSGVLHVVEVKSAQMDISRSELESVSYETKISLHYLVLARIRETIYGFGVGTEAFSCLGWRISVSCETSTESINLIDRVDNWKLQNISRALRHFLSDKPKYRDLPTQIDVMEVVLDFHKKLAIIRVTEQVMSS